MLARFHPPTRRWFGALLGTRGRVLSIPRPRGGLLAVIVLAIVAFTVNPWIGLLVLLYIPFYLMIVDYPSKKTNEILTESMKKREGWLDIGRRIIEEKLSINVLRAENYFENAYEAVNDEYFLYVKRSSFFHQLWYGGSGNYRFYS